MKNICQTLFILSLCLFSPQVSFGQATGDNVPLFGKFLGYDAAGIDLDFRTNNINRMRLMETGTTSINGFNIPTGGHLGLSLTPSFYGTGAASATPFSLLHLNGTGNNNGPQLSGYRDWMQPGIVFTHNRDLMYVGPRRNGADDVTDAVISWSDNLGSGVGPDVLRFLFTAGGSGSTTVSSNQTINTDSDGVEIARMTGEGTMGVGIRWTNDIAPKRTLDIVRRAGKNPQLRLTYRENQNINAGIFSELQTSENGNLHLASSVNGDPGVVAIGFLDEDLDDPSGPNYRLDVGGAARIRDLPIYAPECILIGESFADVNQADPADQFVGRLDFPDEPDPCIVLSSTGQWENVCDLAADCRWVDANSVTVMDEVDITTGFPVGDNDCDRGKVGIGVDLVRRAKLEVENLITRDEINTAIYGGIDLEQQLIISPNFYYGVFGEASNAFLGSTGTTCGVKGFASDSRYHIGVFGESTVTTGSTNSMGVAGLSNGAAGNSIGVYGESAGWSGYFVGGTIQTGTSLIISDESVKTDLAEIENATDILSQLIPKSYTMVTPENRELYFDEGTRFGFIAQEMQEVLPQLVKQTTVPERIDSTGFVEGTSVDLLGIQYTELIPILVAGFQEQNTLISSQAAMLTEQEQENEELISELNELKTQMVEMQNQMTEVMASFQSTQSKMNNCCGTTPSEKSRSETGAIELEQNFPNPFEDVTTINFSINEPAQIRLEISDAQGRVLDVVVNQRMDKGEYTERWDGSAVAPGTYYYSLYADTELLTKKMIKK